MSAPPPPNEVSRRDFLRRTAAAGLLAGPGSGLLAACATGGSGGKDQFKRESRTSDNPLGVPKEAPLEIVIFGGGFMQNGDYPKDIWSPTYTKKYPKAKITQSNTEQIKEQLQPRFNKGEPPDFINNSGASQMDPNALVADNQLMELTELLDAPSVDDPNVKVRDILAPFTVDIGSFGDKMFQLNYAYSIYGIWYDNALFKKNGWTAPKTWQEMLTLCDTINKTGTVKPWTYQGKHPRYMSWPIVSMAAKHGGLDVLMGIDNLEPNAWKHPSIKLAVEAVAELVAKGYILKGSEGLDHKQAQTQWSQGKAAFVPSGSWLEGEQVKVTPPTFEMAYMPEPSLTGSDKLPQSALRGTAGEPYVVPKKAKNVYGGLEYMRLILSKEVAAKWTAMCKSLTVVKGAEQGAQFSPGLGSASKALSDAGAANTFNWFYSTWYRPLERQHIDAAMGELMTGRIKPADWMNRVQKAADDLAKDDSVKKYKREK